MLLLQSGLASGLDGSGPRAPRLRRGNVGLDIIAALSMTAALTFGEHLAAAVVALMYAGGQYLESFAERHARREMTALLSPVPRTAIRYRDNALEEVPLEAVQAGDRLLVRRGDVVPVDGAVSSGLAVLDQSALTGESIPVQQPAGGSVMSGSTNAGDAFDLIDRDARLRAPMRELFAWSRPRSARRHRCRGSPTGLRSCFSV